MKILVYLLQHNNRVSSVNTAGDYPAKCQSIQKNGLFRHYYQKWLISETPMHQRLMTMCHGRVN